MKMRLLGGCRLRATGTQKREVEGDKCKKFKMKGLEK